MFWWEALPWEIRRMIFRYLEKQDICRLAAAGPMFAAFLTGKPKFTPTEWCRYIVWGEQPFAQTADARAVTRVLKHIGHNPIENIDERFSFEAELLLPPVWADKETQSHSGQMTGTLLHLAAYSGLFDVVRFLLSKGADKDISLECNDSAPPVFGLRKVTPVYLAASKKHYAVVELLLRAGAKLGWSTDWPIYRQLPEVLGAMMSQAQHSTDSIKRAFEYVSSAWYDWRKVVKDGKVKKSQLELVNVLIPYCVDNIIDSKDRMESVNYALEALDCSAALALAQAGFARHSDATDEEFDVNTFARACVSKLVSEKDFGDLREMLRILLETRDIECAALDRKLEWRAKTEEQKRRACLLRKVSQGDIV
ncbi:hypothetical protein K4K61_007498 [Colletotrichum sp. SAR11_59]|nr:hypothetical protein K4K61_007498 [Colletotrichum sp. SAR11_59]